MEYGLIGAKLGHSYSKIIHEMLCGYHYKISNKVLKNAKKIVFFLLRKII